MDPLSRISRAGSRRFVGGRVTNSAQERGVVVTTTSERSPFSATDQCLLSNASTNELLGLGEVEAPDARPRRLWSNFVQCDRKAGDQVLGVRDLIRGDRVSLVLQTPGNERFEDGCEVTSLFG